MSNSVPEPDSTCECSHVFDEHAKDGRSPCTIDDCRCRQFELNFLAMLFATKMAQTLSYPQNDGRLIQIVPLLFGKFQLQIGPSDAPVWDDAW